MVVTKLVISAVFGMTIEIASVASFGTTLTLTHRVLYYHVRFFYKLDWVVNQILIAALLGELLTLEFQFDLGCCSHHGGWQW